MIDRPALIAWRSKAPWPDRVQIEQDLLLSRLMIEINRDEVLGPELAMRGGTCLHKLHLPSPLRYSEDLDYVRLTHTGIKPYTQALAKLADEIGLAEELLATKLRALYQRSKGRDLFDLWLGLTVLKADPEQIVAGFHRYMGDAAFSYPELRANLAAKLANASFGHDLDALLTSTPPEYDLDIAANIVMRELGSRLRNAPPVDDIAPLRS